MNILLTNDDGIHARGLAALYDEFSRIGRCLIVAPETEQSAVGHAITFTKPLTMRKTMHNGHYTGYAVAGTPADCVKLGVRILSEETVDLVVSGINRGANVGINVIYSGTVSAATEAAILGVPSMAVSLDSRKEEADFTVAARIARRLAFRMMERPFLKGVTLNVNVPALPEEEIRGIAATRQGATQLLETYDRRTDPRDNIYYWLAGETILPDEDDEADAWALKKGFVSVTPIQYDLTRYNVLKQLAEDLRDFS